MKNLVWLLVACSTFMLSRANTYHVSATADAISLLSFKNSISRDPLNLLASWNSTADHCTWYGVTCDQFSGRVTALRITATESSAADKHSVMSGTLSASIGKLTELRMLSIPHNAFSGEVPAIIGELRVLVVLELQGNNFSGKIPYSISILEHLQVLNLSSNSFSGEIPRRLIGNGVLRAIDLSNNQLSGAFVIDSLSKCEFLTSLKLSNNFLTDNISKDVGKCRNLRNLLLDGNVLEGPIPKEIGRMSELTVLDVSRNSLTERIPVELANCSKLSVVVLTNLEDFCKDDTNFLLMDSSRGEFNAFDGGVPYELLLVQSLKVLWAPRANLGGRLPDNWSEYCSLTVLNLGQNSFNGVVPKSLGMCKNLTYLDLSLNNFAGYLPMQLRVPYMVYFNVSQNNITGVFPRFENASYGGNPSFLDLKDIQNAFPVPVLGLNPQEKFVIVHDFSNNKFFGSLPLFSVGDGFLAAANYKPHYRLLLNNNMFNGSVPGELVLNCNDLQSLSVNLSANKLSGKIYEAFLHDCLQLVEFEAANNQISGSISSAVGKLTNLQCLDLRENEVSGSLPDELGKLKFLKWILLGGNNIIGEISSQFGRLYSLKVLDLSHNFLTGSIPSSLTNATNLEILLLDHNGLSGEVPMSFSALANLTTLNLSFNNLSGGIPHLQHLDCNWFQGNKYMGSCPDTNSNGTASGNLQTQLAEKLQRHKRLKSFIIAVVTSASALLIFLLIVFVILRRKQFGRLASLRGKVMVTFADTPAELTYDNVVRATGNFSIRNLIGTGGFGSTYKAELVPGYLVAVKKLSIGRFQGIQQFDAEIRTLGRIRHKNLVTLIGYYVGEAEMFLVYNYLSGGNLETFIHNRSGKNVQWPVIHKIAIDIAQALAYLHYSCVPRIVHRDIKPSNILLDEELNAYLSDFGLAKLLDASETHATTDVAGTFGYVAPEYATTCRVSDKADVYSFGVVLLELMSGKKSIDPSFSEYGNGFNIVSLAKLLIKEGRCSELFCPALWETGPKDNLLEMLNLASTCTVETLASRPSVKQVLEKLKQLK